MRAFVCTILLAGTLIGCASWRGNGATAPSSGPSVAVRLEGAALSDEESRTAAVGAFERATGRRVDVVDDTANEALLRGLATRIGAERSAVRRYDWREPRCRSQADALTAARVGADAVYRLKLTAAAMPSSRGFLDALRTPAAPVTGEMTVRLFDGSETQSRTAVAGDDVASAVTAGSAALPKVLPARWDAVANDLVKAGCPFMALAVQDLQMHDARAGRAVKERAVAAMARAVAPRKAVAAPVPVAEPETPVVPEAAEAASARDTRFSCEALCDIHMVEVCNKDRTLWNQHLVAWERTGCGTRRTEPFLVECYRRQRISGTFHDACVMPCERTPEGRNALLEMLQGAGCLRSGPS